MNSKVLIVFLIGCFAGALCHELCIDSCPQNEVFSECNAGATCQLTCSTRNSTVGDCGCVSGCICKTGYIRDANTYKCIRKSTCPPIPKVNSTTCAKNEVYSVSGAGCQKNCYTQNRQYKCAPKSGCICKTGYIRSPITNQCILKSSCEKCPSGYYLDTETKRCKLSCDICMDYNAEFNTCGDRCRELTCENPLLEGIKCPDDVQCEPGCFCKAGYIKDPKTQLCIRPKSCPNPCKDPNAVYSNCGTNNTCDMQTCRFPYGQGDLCMKVCSKGCFCKPGYVKNDDSGKCVLLKNCPIKQCLKNEIYERRNPSCEPGCLIKPCMSVNCENKCYCRDGYVKENGTCILLSKCKKCDDPNSTYNNCKKECSDETCLNPNGTSELCKGNCRAGCFCNKGYVLDHTGKCILLNKCPKCPANESFTCSSATCEKNCGNLNETCTIINIKCDNKCFCNEGFVRETPYGPCIPILKCPPNDCKINEVLECRNPTCDDEGCCIEKERPCKDVPYVNKCYCADGYVRIDGACVTRDICFKNQCPVNETMDCRDLACTQEVCLKDSTSCMGGSCEERCYCDYGYARINGICVPRENCQIYCTDSNSTYNLCGSACTSTCDNRYIAEYCPDVCAEDCFCNSGLIKDSSGICIPVDQCPIPTCKDPNSEYSCGNPHCEPTCNTLGQACDVFYTYCDKKCYCKSGYVLSDTGICIPIEKCPEKCPANEVFSCDSAACEKNCGNINDTCDIVNKKCDDKCFCIEGYVREFGPNGPCIPVNNCPIIDPPPPVCLEPYTEFNQCASSCQPTCLKPFIGICNKMCNAICVCENGFIQNENGRCVKPYECVETSCTANEVLACRNPTCDYEGCDVIEDETCQDVPCKMKCYCAPGFLRINGVCVPINKCKSTIIVLPSPKQLP